ncbi:MAG: CoA-binding protein, partial [Burkholderiales bacterium]|nr:CoA-binding protein [Burkholderiales bacterium]
MQNPSNAGHGAASLTSATAAILRQASAAGRDALNQAELGALLSGLSIGFKESPTPAANVSAVEVRISLNNTREFGMVLSAGLGGLDAELDEGNFRNDRASVYAAAELTDAGDFLGLFRRTLAYQKLAGVAARAGQALPDTQLKSCFAQLLALADCYAPGKPEAPFVLRTLELNPVQVGDQLVVQAARCEFGAPAAVRLARPIHKIDKLLHPASIGLIGVSASGMNFGRIILRNLMGSGYSKERLTIIRPGEKEIDGVKCAESLSSLPQKLDLLIVAVAASAVYDLVDEIIATDAV